MANDMLIKDQMKAMTITEDATEVRKKPRQEMTVAHLKSHQFSTPAVQNEAEQRTAARKSRCEGICVDLSIQLGLPLNEV